METWLRSRIDESWYYLEYWFWFAEYAVIVNLLVVRKSWGWYGVWHVEARYAGKRRGTERASRAMYRDRSVYRNRGGMYSVAATLRMAQYGGETSSVIQSRLSGANDNGYGSHYVTPMTDRMAPPWAGIMPTVKAVVIPPEWVRIDAEDTVLFYPIDLRKEITA